MTNISKIINDTSSKNLKNYSYNQVKFLRQFCNTKGIIANECIEENGRFSMMYLIAICDDEEKELDKTEYYLRSWQQEHQEYEFKIERFDNPEELLWRIREEKYSPDLVFMDIYMPQKTGSMTAKELRDMGNDGSIIFLTSSKEHALEAFGVNAVQYLVKPVTEKELFPVIDRLLSGIEKRLKNYVLFRINGRDCRVAFENIVCCEAQGKSQRLYFSDGTYGQLRMTMTEIYGMLSGRPEFVRVGASYIVSLGHIDSISAQEICLDTGKSIYLPRGAYQPLREQYFKYYCEDGF